MTPAGQPFERKLALTCTADHALRQVVLMKRGQRYVFRYTPGEEKKLLDDLVAMARDPQCDLDWFDAAVLSHQMGQRLSQELREALRPR